MAKSRRSQKLLKKTTSFGGTEMTLYSLDGSTWSSRPDELEQIKERHEKQRVQMDASAGGDDSADSKKESGTDGKAKGDEKDLDQVEDDVNVEESKVEPAKRSRSKAKQSSVKAKAKAKTRARTKTKAKTKKMTKDKAKVNKAANNKKTTARKKKK